MKTKKARIGIREIAEAAGVDYRTALRHFNSGRFLYDPENPADSLLSWAVYISGGNAISRLLKVMERLEKENEDETGS
jgi:hypothetical protein